MRISVVLEQQFRRTPGGQVWTANQFPYEFWRRYLSVFDGVNVVGRAAEVDREPPGWARVDGPGVSVSPIPHYRGAAAYLRRRSAVGQACRASIGRGDAVSLRLGSILALHVSPVLQACGRPYGVDVVSDPFDAFAPGSIRHPLRPALRWYLLWRTRSICSRAAAALYVTERYLQQRYPVASGVPEFFASSVLLPKGFVRGEGRGFEPGKGSWRLVFVGSLAQRYKGLHVLLPAMARAVRQGAHLELTAVGEGKERPALERQAAELGIEQRVSFKGGLPREAVVTELDKADIFVLPSFTEGLPRALIEAMARGLPCLATSVGGIPELLGPEVLVDKGDERALAEKLLAFTRDPLYLSRLSQFNVERARCFTDELMLGNMRCFWTCLKNQTEDWLRVHEVH